MTKKKKGKKQTKEERWENLPSLNVRTIQVNNFSAELPDTFKSPPD